MGLDLILPRKSSSANNRGASNGVAKTSNIQGTGLSKGVSPVAGVSKTTQVADFSANVPLRPKITVIGVGGGGGNAVRNMIASHLLGVDFVVANTDAQALELTECEYRVQLGETLTGGLGAGARPEVGRQAAEDSKEEVQAAIVDSNMVFVTAGMGGGTGTGAAPIVAKIAKDLGILTVGVVTKPFSFEGRLRMQVAEKGIAELRKYVDTMIVIPNQNLFKLAKDDTPMTVAMAMADNVLYQGVAGITDLMLVPGIINLDFADIRTAMSEMGTAVLGTGEAEGSDRAKKAAELATSNPLLDDLSIRGARSLLINITSGDDLTIHEVNDAVDTITREVHESATIIYGHSVCNEMDGKFRVSIVATGIDSESETEDIGPSGFADKDTYSIKPSRTVSENVRQEFSARKNVINDTAVTQSSREANKVKMDHNYTKVRANKVESTIATKNYNSVSAAEKELYLDDDTDSSKMFVNDKPIAGPTNSYSSVALKNNYHHSVVDNSEDEEIDIVKQAFDDEGYIQASGLQQQDELFELIGDDYSENLLPEENQSKLTGKERDIKYRLKNIKSNEQDSIFSQILSFASSKSKKNSIIPEEKIVSTTKATDVNIVDKVKVQNRDADKKDDSKKNEGLEIPSFLRRQAN